MKTRAVALGQPVEQLGAHMPKGLIARHAEVGLCGTCLDTRGLSSAQFVDRAERSSMDELAAWVIWADRVITF